MPSLIDWYLVELKMKLQGRVPAARIEEILKETESHLRESVASRAGASSPEGDAIKAFGLPEPIATAYLGGGRLMRLKPIWWALIGAAIAVYCWNFLFLTQSGYFDNLRETWAGSGYFDNSGETWQYGLAALVGLIGLSLVSAAARRACRSFWWQIGGFTALLAVLSIPIMSYWMIAMPTPDPPVPPYDVGISRFHLRRDIDLVSRTISELGKYRAFLIRGEDIYGKAKSPADLPEDMREVKAAASEFGVPSYTLMMSGAGRGPFVVPYQYSYAFVDGRVTVLDTSPLFSDAKEEWRDQAREDIAELDGWSNGMRRLLAAAKEAQHGKLFFPSSRVWGLTLTLTLIFAPVLMLFGWLGYLSSRRRSVQLERALA